MAMSRRVGYLESPLNEEQKGHRSFMHNVVTSLGERHRKHQRQLTHERGTDTELEARHKDLLGAQKCYQGLPKQETAQYGRKVHTDTSGEENVHENDYSSDHSSRDTQLRCSSTQQKVLVKPTSQVFEENLLMKFQTNESNLMPPVLDLDCGLSSGALPKQLSRAILEMQKYNDEEEGESQADELLVAHNDKTAEVDVCRGESRMKPVGKHTAKNDAVFEHVTNDSIGDVLGPSKSRPSHKPEIEKANVRVMTSLPRLKKILVSPEWPRHSVQVIEDDLMESFAAAATQISVLSEVNTGLQANINAAEQKLNKYRDKSVALANELRRIQEQKERLEKQLEAAQVNSKLQTRRIQFTEEEGKLLRKKIHEGEEAFSIKVRSAKDQLEGRLVRSQEALEKAEGEKQAALREIRQLQRCIDETSKVADAERKRGREFENENDKINQQIKKLEARLHDAKLERSLENARRLDVKRQVQDALERREKLKRDLLAACSEVSSSNNITGRLTGIRNDARNLMADAPNSGAPSAQGSLRHVAKRSVL